MKNQPFIAITRLCYSYTSVWHYVSLMGFIPYTEGFHVCVCTTASCSERTEPVRICVNQLLREDCACMYMCQPDAQRGLCACVCNVSIRCSEDLCACMYVSTSCSESSRELN